MIRRAAIATRMTGLWQSANEPAFALFCNPESRRTEGFYGAVGRLLGQKPIAAAWLAVLEHRNWESLLNPAPRFLRLESPGRNWWVERELLNWGAAIQDEESTRPWRRLPAEEVGQLENDPGRIHPMRQLFLGWRAVLRKVS